MGLLAIIVGTALGLLVLLDTFETIILPRTVTRPFRIARIFYTYTWIGTARVARRLKAGRQQTVLAAYGPMSLLVLFAVWAQLLILAFGLIDWGLQLSFTGMAAQSFGEYLYYSGVTFLTLGYGDLAPLTGLGRALAVLEAGVGFGFLAVVISYLPVLYQSFSRRELAISLLDARAGSPPTAGELLRRFGDGENMAGLEPLLAEWEKWAADLLESYLSYPVLAFYRSQHERQSWLSSIAAILDTCSLIQVGFMVDAPWQKPLLRQARLTFAMARHALVDLALILDLPPEPPAEDRLLPAEWQALRNQLREAGIGICEHPMSADALAELRAQYEPYLSALSQELFIPLPPWVMEVEAKDNWETSAFDTARHF